MWGVVPFFRREASLGPAVAAPAGGRDETAREVRGLMRVGNYASRTMVKGESVVELVLMCASESWGAVYVRTYVCTCVYPYGMYLNVFIPTVCTYMCLYMLYVCT